MPSKDQPRPYPLRMPDELRGQLDEAATKANRSLNAEIVGRLDRSLHDDPEKPHRDVVELFLGAALLNLSRALMQLESKLPPDAALLPSVRASLKLADALELADRAAITAAIDQVLTSRGSPGSYGRLIDVLVDAAVTVHMNRAMVSPKSTGQDDGN